MITPFPHPKRTLLVILSLGSWNLNLIKVYFRWIEVHWFAISLHNDPVGSGEKSEIELCSLNCGVLLILITRNVTFCSSSSFSFSWHKVTLLQFYLFFLLYTPSSPQTLKPDLLFSFWCRFYTVAEFNAIKWPCYSGIVYLSFRSARSECNGGVERNAIACFLLDGKQRVRARGWSSNSFFFLCSIFFKEEASRGVFLSEIEYLYLKSGTYWKWDR